MTTEVKEIQSIDVAIAEAIKKFGISQEDLDRMKDTCLCLTVKSPQDVEGYMAVKDQKKKVSKCRIAIDKTRKALKAESLKFGKAVQEEANRITDHILIAEEHLEEQCKIVEDEKIRLVAEAEEKVRLEKERVEREEKEKIEAEQKAEQDRLDAVRKEQESKDKELADRQAKIEAAEKRIADDAKKVAAAKQKVKDDEIKEQIKKDAAAQAVIDEKARVEKEKAQKKFDEEDAKSKMGDNEKLVSVAEQLDGIQLPLVEGAESVSMLIHAEEVLTKLSKTLREGV